MKLENSFEVPAPPETVWDFLLDVERVAPCLPGAELTDVVDDTTWKGKVNVRLGAVSLTYRGTVNVAERDDAAHRVTLKAKGQETHGKGLASATMTSALKSVDGVTKVEITTDMTLSGAVAQFGRGMIGDVSRRLTDQFAECLRRQLEPQVGVAETTEPQAPPAARVKGGRLALWAIGQAGLRLLRRIARALGAAARAFRAEVRRRDDE